MYSTSFGVSIKSSFFFLFVGIAGSYYITLHLLTHKNGIVINLSKGNLWCHFRSILKKNQKINNINSNLLTNCLVQQINSRVTIQIINDIL